MARNTRNTRTSRLADAARREGRDAVLVRVIHARRGNVIEIARALRIPRQKVYQGPIWLRPHLREEVRRAREGLPPLPIPRVAQAELLALLSGAVVLAGGNLARAAPIAGVTGRTMGRYVERLPGLRALVDRARRARACAPWLVRTAGVLSLAPMLEQVVAAAQGMSVEEIAGEIRASVHGGSCDPDQLAEAIAAAAVDAPAAGG